MRIAFIMSFVGLYLVIVGCSPKPIEPVAIPTESPKISYLNEIRPILDQRCVVCHSCYNAPCQLKLSSYEGLDRGANKIGVYNAGRPRAAKPTRLFTDAQTTEQWQTEYDFFSVTANHTNTHGYNDATLLTLLDAKRRLPDEAKAEYRPEEDELTCPANHAEVEAYLDEHPERGMPYGFPPLEASEFDTVAAWVGQGAPGPDAAEQQALTRPGTFAAARIAQWEAFLNQKDAKHVMTARYVYDHLFLGHIYFGGDTREFYELVRSKTPSGEPIDVIATVRPYDDPKMPFFYRFRKIHSTIVHKTHIVVHLTDKTLTRVKTWFIDTPWIGKPTIVDYGINPFVTYAQIPPAIRYRFMLDHAEYFVRTFIRGPVCRGQVALNVINDHFWIMFLGPATDLTTRFPGMLTHWNTSLETSAQDGSDPSKRSFFIPFFDSLFKYATALGDDRYIQKAIDYYKMRQDQYRLIYPEGLGYDAIWPGAETDDAPLMTIYRHFDSASVHKGALGNLPKTLWVIDYPLFERLYYALVSGYDVFGNVVHQTLTRRFMDRLRVEGESFFLDFLPHKERQALFDAWNLNPPARAEEKITYYPSPMPAKVDYTALENNETPKQHFVETLIDAYLKEAGISLDPLNYVKDAAKAELPKHYETEQDYDDAMRAVAQPGSAFIRHANGHDANVALIRVRMPQGGSRVYTMVINRWHDNVTFIMHEEDRMDAKKDDIDFIPGYIGSYPNFFFDVPLKKVPEFLDMLKNFDVNKHEALFFELGIARNDPRFWSTYDWFQKDFIQKHPIEAGLFDLNRYYHKAW